MADPSPTVLRARVEQRVLDALAALNATTTAQLVSGGPARTLRLGDMPASPYSKGRILFAELVVAPGAPGDLGVPSELSLRCVVQLDGEKISISECPTRADLETAVRQMLSTEARAYAAAEKAFAQGDLLPGPGFSSWKQALRAARLDPRLPREMFAGTPTWHFIFNPWNERSGYRSVLLDAASGAVQLLNGQPPRGRGDSP